MIDVLMWCILIFSFVGVLVFGFLVITVFRATMRIMEKLEYVEDKLSLKQDRPQPPPNVIPLERM